MNDLQRERAPFSSAVWDEIDEEARRILKLSLAARKLVDFDGPLGWNVSAIDLGRTKALANAPATGAEAHLRQSQPLVELRVPFRFPRAEAEAIARGAKDGDLAPVVEAAQALARAEDKAIFHGYADARIEGICEAAAGETLSLSEDFLLYPSVVSEALNKLKSAGVDGPYAIALGPRCYAGLTKTTTEAGFPVLEHVQRLLDGPVVWAPAVDGAVVMSTRGGDFQLTVGRDISIGYFDHSATEVELYMEESLTFRVLANEAAIPLAYRT